MPLAHALLHGGFATEELSIYGEGVTLVFTDSSALARLRGLISTRSDRFARRARCEEHARAWRYSQRADQRPELKFPVEDIQPLVELLQQPAATKELLHAQEVPR